MPAKAKKVLSANEKSAESEVKTESEEAAKEAGLRYVADDRPGYSRKANGDGFVYFDAEGRPIRDEPRILHINRLAIPPAYTKVWICPAANGHLQATGIDARGRKQYRYHERWREVRDENKYERMLTFGRMLPKIRRRVKKDMAQPGLPKTKVVATIVALLERTFIRVGNEEYARENKSFGLTTMRNRHVDVTGATVRFAFRGKSGVHHTIDVSDRRVARIVKKLEDLPGQELFQFLDEENEIRDVTSDDVNEYLGQVSGQEFTAKDFRTWAGTILAAMALTEAGAFENKKQAKQNVRTAITAVSKILGNTPAVCRKCYVHPVILETYLSGEAIAGLKQRTEQTLADSLDDLTAAEAAVLSFLQERLAKKKK